MSRYLLELCVRNVPNFGKRRVEAWITLFFQFPNDRGGKAGDLKLTDHALDIREWKLPTNNRKDHFLLLLTINIMSEDNAAFAAEDIIVQGFRRTRNRTNWLYRGSALTTTDSLDIEDLRLAVHDYETALAYIASTFTTIALVAKSRQDQGLSVGCHKKAMEHICVATTWIIAHIECLYLDIEDRLYFVHTVRPFQPNRLRRISEFTDDNHSHQYFGFKLHELRSLLLHWRIPTLFREANYVFEGEGALLIFLFHIRTATPNTQMARDMFGGDPRRFTHFIRAITDHLYTTFYHKISGDSMRMWIPYINEFRSAIWDKLQDGIINETDRQGTEIDWEILLPEDTFRIFGWLDDTDMRTNRPRSGRVISEDQATGELRDTQQAFYK